MKFCTEISKLKSFDLSGPLSPRIEGVRFSLILVEDKYNESLGFNNCTVQI